jgi:hypothetical protein
MTLQHRIGLVYLRGALPCFEDFGAQASLNLDIIMAVVSAPKLTAVNYGSLAEQFKNLLTNYDLNASKGGDWQKC